MRPSRLIAWIAVAVSLQLMSVAGPAALASGGVTSADEKYSIGSTTDIPNLSDGSVHVVKIEYLPGTLSVFLDGLRTPVLAVPLDLEAVISSIDGTAWVGFTAATGADGENHDILSFTFGPSASAQSTLPFQLVEDAAQLEDRLRLTPAESGRRGAAWSMSKQAVRDGFVSMFRFQITDVVRAGADGFAFIVQNWDARALIGGGGGLGYTGMAHALAVEFDTWQNLDFRDPDSVGDPNHNHVSAHIPLPDLGGRFDSELPFSPGVDWEPVLAVDPSSSHVYMVVTGYGDRECQQCAHPSIQYRVSPDGGDSWGPVKFVCGASCQADHFESAWQVDPTIKVANDGTVFVAWLVNGWNTVVARSFDHGETFTRPVIATQSGAGWADFPRLAISADGRDVYVAIYSYPHPHVVASHDGGATFGNPVRLVPPTDMRIWGAEGGVVAPDGTVYFSMSVESTWAAANLLGTGPVDLTVARSQDKGATWSIVTIDRSEEAPPCAVESCLFSNFWAQIVIDMDAAGTLLVAYMKNTRAAEPKKFFSRTSADGVHWSEPSLINDQGDSNYPVVSHGPEAGDFRVAWQDNRNGPFAWNTWYRRTTDAGKSWTEEARLSDVGSVTFYKSAAGYVFPYGDYFGMATDAGGTNFLIWGEGTSRAGAGGCWYTRGQ